MAALKTRISVAVTNKNYIYIKLYIYIKSICNLCVYRQHYRSVIVKPEKFDS